jgi:hypothetical protein
MDRPSRPAHRDERIRRCLLRLRSSQATMRAAEAAVQRALDRCERSWLRRYAPELVDERRAPADREEERPRA